MPDENDSLFAALESVHNEETFVHFLIALRDNREASLEQEAYRRSSHFGPDAMGWENTTVERFFDAAARWARASTKGLPLAGYDPPSNPWRRCADILHAAIGYE
jgi:hypothetical protein